MSSGRVPMGHAHSKGHGRRAKTRRSSEPIQRVSKDLDTPERVSFKVPATRASEFIGRGGSNVSTQSSQSGAYLQIGGSSRYSRPPSINDKEFRRLSSADRSLQTAMSTRQLSIILPASHFTIGIFTCRRSARARRELYTSASTLIRATR